MQDARGFHKTSSLNTTVSFCHPRLCRLLANCCVQLPPVSGLVIESLAGRLLLICSTTDPERDQVLRWQPRVVASDLVTAMLC